MPLCFGVRRCRHLCGCKGRGASNARSAVLNKHGRRNHEKSCSSHPNCSTRQPCYKLFANLRNGQGEVHLHTVLHSDHSPQAQSSEEEGEDDEEEEEEDKASGDDGEKNSLNHCHARALVEVERAERAASMQTEEGVAEGRTPALLSSSYQAPPSLSLPHPQHLASYRRIPSFSPPRRFALRTPPALPLPVHRLTAVESLLHLAPSISAGDEQKQQPSTAAAELADLREELRRARGEVDAMNATMAWMQRDRMEKEEQWKAKEAAWAEEKAELDQRILTLQRQLDVGQGGQEVKAEKGNGHALQGAPPSPLVMPTPVLPPWPCTSPAPPTRPSQAFTHAPSSPFSPFFAPSHANGSAPPLSAAALSSASTSSSSSSSYPLHPHPMYAPPASSCYSMYSGAYASYGYPSGMPSFSSPMSTLRTVGLCAPSMAIALPASSAPQQRRGSVGVASGKKKQHSLPKS